ncbi:hypothetical protein [Agrococcus sp. Marseille-Q4369]|uniref:hypothetical protein n=1 Tax=Agrococcus sp. Marseille-Q4369 TaxID=2810513 RepID=UPI001B8C81B1|nr:hypothetical protein [Agrococcus sp. Marseille-Q4369]QUW19402.1 hypothetical protein JSQ78_03500 [Agrococcus sp. Marseille-Q4369]
MLLQTIARGASAEVEISRSRFVATAHRIASLDELAPLVRDARRANADARYVCTAAIIGRPSRSTRRAVAGVPERSGAMCLYRKKFPGRLEARWSRS